MIGIDISLEYGSQRSQLQMAIDAIRRNNGVLYWPADNLSGMWTDSTGLSPVTTVGDVLGKINDRCGSANAATQATTASKPLITRVPKRVGTELVVNGSNETALFTFGTALSSDTLARAAAPGGGFAASATSTTSSSAEHRLLDSSFSLSAGKAYRITGRFYVPTGGVATFRLYDAGDGSWSGLTSTTKDQWVPFSVVRTAKGSNWALGFGDNVPGVVTSGQIAYWIDDLSVSEVLEFSNAMSFDGSNDSLQTGLTTGNEGWVCAGVNAAATNATLFASGAGAAGVKGIWLARDAGGPTYLITANGSALQYSPTLTSPSNTPTVISAGWDASTAFTGVDATESATAVRSGDATSANPLRMGVYVNGSTSPLNGQMSAAVYCAKLPNAADRALIRRWIGSLQGQTL
jgi:hypothetical protein